MNNTTIHITRRNALPRKLGEVYFIWQEKSIMEYLKSNFTGVDLRDRLAAYTALTWIHNEYNGQDITQNYAEIISSYSGIGVKKVRKITDEFEVLGFIRKIKTVKSGGRNQVKTRVRVVFDPSKSNIYIGGLRSNGLKTDSFERDVSTGRKRTDKFKELSIDIDRFSVKFMNIINNNIHTIPVESSGYSEYFSNFNYEKEIVPLIKKWNDISSVSKGKTSVHKFPETNEAAAKTQSKTVIDIVRAIISLRLGCFTKTFNVRNIPKGHIDQPMSLEEISGVLSNVSNYFKNSEDYKSRFIPKALSQVFYNSNPKSKLHEESFFLEIYHKPIVSETLGGMGSIKKYVSQEIYDSYHLSLFHDITEEQRTLLWYMIGKVYRAYYKIKSDMEQYYKHTDAWGVLFSSFKDFSYHHIEFIRQSYGSMDIHPGFLATDKKVWARFTEEVEKEFGIIFHPTDVQCVELGNKRYQYRIEHQGMEPEGFDDEFRTREDRINHNRDNIINLQQKRAERSVQAK